FFNPNAEEKFLMEEANELSNFVQDIDSNVEVIWGLAFDETLGNKVKMTILAAGFDFSLYKEEEDVKKGHKGRQSPVAPLMKEYDINTPDTKDKNRQRFVILSPDQMDDDEIIDYLEKNPTLTRDKASVERIREQRGTTDSPEPIKKRQSNNRIEF
ncbi:MAG: hypothetical protein HUK13_09990, partial [Muribaculaceae bacterium]|nr:hypothetical protein [Muribaculaceae bacterium]